MISSQWSPQVCHVIGQQLAILDRSADIDRAKLWGRSLTLKGKTYLPRVSYVSGWLDRFLSALRVHWLPAQSTSSPGSKSHSSRLNVCSLLVCPTLIHTMHTFYVEEMHRNGSARDSDTQRKFKKQSCLLLQWLAVSTFLRLLIGDSLLKSFTGFGEYFTSSHVVCYELFFFNISSQQKKLCLMF